MYCSVCGAPSLADPSRCDGTVLLAEDSPELVIAASELMADGRAELLDGHPVFCGGELTRELVRPEDTVGRRISISLRPGVGPPRARRDSLASQQTRPRDFTNAEPQIVFRAFYIDAEVAYVAVSSGCLMRPGGVSVAQPLDDGRVVGAFGSGATYELRRDNSGWSVVAVSSRWIP